MRIRLRGLDLQHTIEEVPKKCFDILFGLGSGPPQSSRDGYTPTQTPRVQPTGQIIQGGEGTTLGGLDLPPSGIEEDGPAGGS